MEKGKPIESEDKRIGNQFWKLRSKHGRDKIFTTPESMQEAAFEYFQWCEDNPLKEQQIVKYKDTFEKATIDKMRPFTLMGLCMFLGVNSVYFNQFEDQIKKKDDETSKEFSKVITHIREIIYNQKFTGAAAGFLNPNIIAMEIGLKARTDITTDGNEIKQTPTIINLGSGIKPE
jgi:hypothetical protein